jgi:cytochrome c553
LAQRGSGKPFRDDNPGMKIFLRGLLCAGVLVAACTSRTTPPGGEVPPPKPVKPPQLAPTRAAELAVTPAPALAPAANGEDGFAKTVRPVLLAHCAPCHEPGGKMYDRLPFDRPETIASHREKVLRRLKGENREAVAQWLAGLPDRAAATP